MTENNERPIILVTNDDGITAPGIRSLVEAVKDLGDVVVVAPDKPQSGMGHAITIGVPLRLNKVDDMFEGVESWQISGTPVDCVKLAVDKILHRKPDICLSGINHGANHSINVIYSGTMSAAMEFYVHKIVESLLHRKMHKHFLLNVNIPAVPLELMNGIKVCKQAYAKYDEDFDERLDPHGKKYYWLTGEFKNFDKGEDTDVWALEHNFVSVVPVQFDLTNYALKAELEKNWDI